MRAEGEAELLFLLQSDLYYKTYTASRHDVTSFFFYIVYKIITHGIPLTPTICF